MVKHACQLLLDAHVIAEHQDDVVNGGAGEYILRLAALEVLMKAGAVREEHSLRSFGHDFRALFEAQAPAVRDWLRSEFGARSLAAADLAAGSTLPEQLEGLTSNYTTARYVYEKSLPLTDQERRAKERAFVAGELPVAEWDIVYRHELVRLLTQALTTHLAPWLPNWFDRAVIDA